MSSDVFARVKTDAARCRISLESGASVLVGGLMKQNLSGSELAG